MRFRGKKMAVLHQLSQEDEAVGLPQLIEKLGPDFSSRSVRRWLAEMVKEGLVAKTGLKKGTRYEVLQRDRREARCCFSSRSEKILAEVRRPLFERMPITYNDNWVNSYHPNETFYIPPEIRLQLHQAGKRSKMEDPAGTYAHQIFNRLLIDLSYNSSRLEGNTYSLLDTEKLLLEGAGVEGKLEEEKVMILNHKEAIRYLVDTAPRLNVCTETICTLHYLLAEGLIETRYAGKIRDQNVGVVGSTYLPFEDPKQLKIRFNQIVKKAAMIQDAYEQSLFLLIHISYLQAFLDVNKRTARLSANIPLIKNNLVPLSFNDVDRDDYISSLIAIYELQNIHPILELYVFSYLRTCSLYDATVKSIGVDTVRVRYRNERRSMIRDIIERNLHGQGLDRFISSQTPQLVKKEDQRDFIEDLQEDLREIDGARIAGLGITHDQLNHWLTS